MNELLKSLACSGTECLSWILVFVNILAVFYLVFCSFWKVSKLVRIIGWVWMGVLLGVTMGILIFHTCIYTLLVTIFTMMMFMAILSVILPHSEKSAMDNPRDAKIVPATLSTTSKKVAQPMTSAAKKKPCPASTLPMEKRIVRVQPCGTQFVCTKPCPTSTVKSLDTKKELQSTHADGVKTIEKSAVCSVKKNCCEKEQDRNNWWDWCVLASATVLTMTCTAAFICNGKKKRR